MDGLKRIVDVKKELEAAEETMLPSFILKYQTDERAGVQKLAAQARKRLKDLEQERKRIEALKVYEKQYQDKKYICGIDEAGRPRCWLNQPLRTLLSLLSAWWTLQAQGAFGRPGGGGGSDFAKKLRHFVYQ